MIFILLSEYYSGEEDAYGHTIFFYANTVNNH